MFDCGASGDYTVIPDIKTPWPSVDDMWEGGVNRCMVRKVRYYNINSDYLEWRNQEEEKKRAALLRKKARARYKHMVRIIHKIHMKMAGIPFRNSLELCFLRLVLLTTSLYGWDSNRSLAQLYGLVNLGFMLSIS